MPVPYAITRQDNGLVIDWEPQGHQGFYPARALRLACGCAACADEMSSRPLLDPATVPADIRPVEVALVGGYGLRVRWSDGHGTGIYTFQHLLELCPCDRCRAARENAPPTARP
jgi:ATP-binding protein involved in chromosome partitioning